MVLLLMFGCGRNHYPTCEYETREVADDDAGLGDLPFTVSDLLALVVGTFDIPAVASIDSVTSVELHGSRGDGSAVFEDGTEGDDVTPFFGIGDQYIDIGVVCDDRITVPVTLDVISNDGSFVIAGDATLMGESYGDGGVDANASGVVDDGGALSTSDAYALGSLWAGFDGDGLYRLDIELGTGETLAAPPGYP